MTKYIRTLPKEFVVYDLEFTDPKAMKSGEYPEIIEIGACKINPSAEIEDTFYSVVKPSSMQNVTPFIKDLTGMNYEEIQSADPLDIIWPQFNSFCDGSRMMSWTWKDHEILNANIAGLQKPKFRQPMFDAMSFVAGFATEWGLDFGSYGIKGVKNYFGVESTSHRALADAKSVVTILSNF